jgi:hypothetical protein
VQGLREDGGGTLCHSSAMAEQRPDVTTPETSTEAPPSKTRETVIVGAPFESEDVPPAFVNLVTVDGGDALTVNLFYVHPAKITRLVDSSEAVRASGGVKIGEIMRVPSEPVARIALSMNTAAELMVSLFRGIVLGSPGLREELLPVAGARMGALARMVDLGDIFSEQQELPQQEEENE